MKTKTASSRWLLASATLAALAASTATAMESPAASAPATSQAQSSLDSGVRAYVDPATGKLRQATAAERAEEARLSAEAAKQRKGKGVRFVKRADGAVRAEDLEGRFMESVVVVRNPDGSLSYGYASGDASQVDPAQTPVAAAGEDK